jgi:hypothetical protein
VQVDPIKPKLKPPGTKRLKVKCDILRFNSAFKSNLRRYNEVASICCMLSSGNTIFYRPKDKMQLADHAHQAGAYTRALFCST